MPDGAGGVGWDEDFLYHLSRGSEFLLDNRVVEAKEELERALGYRPADAKGQDLLAGVYFRLGVYPRAIEIWERLTRSHPQEPTLRVNLGLALFKTGQPEEALGHLEHALAHDPENARAWGYRGLILWRMGRLPEARDAFLRGGQASMARRMEELVASSTGLTPPPPPPPASSREVTAVRNTADEAIARLHTEESPLVLETLREGRRASSGHWKVVESGTDAIPRHPQPRRPTAVDAPMALGTLLDWWAPAIPEREPLVVSSSGQLLLTARGDVALHARASGLRMLRGRPTTSTLSRKLRRGGDETLGGETDPLMRWEGDFVAVLAPDGSERFQALGVEDDVLYVVERFVHAFDDRIVFESGWLPSPSGPERVLQFRGSGTLVLRLPRPPTAVPVSAGQDVWVVPGSLLGWTGRLFPASEAIPAGLGADGAFALRGDGTVLLV